MIDKLIGVIFIFCGLMIVLLMLAEYDQSSGNASRRKTKKLFKEEQNYIKAIKKDSPQRIRAFKEKFKHLQVPRSRPKP